jgi:hypothetical protein
MRKTWTSFEDDEFIPIVDEALQELTREKCEFETEPELAYMFSRYPKWEKVNLLYTCKNAQNGSKRGSINLDVADSIALVDKEYLIVNYCKVVAFEPSSQWIAFSYIVQARWKEGKLQVHADISAKASDLAELDPLFEYYLSLEETTTRCVGKR